MPKAANRGPQTKAKNKYNQKNYDTILFLVKKGNKEQLKKYAADKGMSMNEFIKAAVKKALDEYGSTIEL